jgi:hypothetical protein
MEQEWKGLFAPPLVAIGSHLKAKPVASKNADRRKPDGTFTRNGATQFFISQSLEIDFVFRANIKPAYQRRIRIIPERSLVPAVVSLRKRAVKPDTKVSSKQRRPQLALCGDMGSPFALAVLILFFPVSLVISKQENLD